MQPKAAIGAGTEVLLETAGIRAANLGRVYLAGDLLRTTQQSLAEMADTCGFCGQSYFTRVFQDMKGVTPKQFQASGTANGG